MNKSNASKDPEVDPQKEVKEIEMSIKSFCPVPGLQNERTGCFSREELEGFSEKEFLRALEGKMKDLSIVDQEILDAVESFYGIHAPERVETMLGIFKYSLAHRFVFNYDSK